MTSLWRALSENESETDSTKDVELFMENLVKNDEYVTKGW